MEISMEDQIHTYRVVQDKAEFHEVPFKFHAKFMYPCNIRCAGNLAFPAILTSFPVNG